MDILEREIIGEPIIIELAGKSCRLAYPVKAVILYKQKTGDNLFVIENWHKIAPGEDPERFLACLWAGLQTHQPEMTIEELGTIVDFSNAADLTGSISEALASYFPKKKKEANPNVEAPETDLVPAAS